MIRPAALPGLLPIRFSAAPATALAFSSHTCYFFMYPFREDPWPPATWCRVHRPVDGVAARPVSMDPRTRIGGRDRTTRPLASERAGDSPSPTAPDARTLHAAWRRCHATLASRPTPSAQCWRALPRER